MDAGRVLADLDKHAAEFNFPVMDNAYVEYAAARLSAFRTETKWLIAFEVLGFSIREVQFVDDLYAYGSCVPREGFIGEEILFASDQDAPLFDPETNEFKASWKRWSVERNGEVHFFSPTLDDYRAAGVSLSQSSGSEGWREIDLLRFLVHSLGESLFMTTDELLKRLPLCGSMPLFLQSREWEHPDISRGERPSTSVSIQTLMDALSHGDPALFKSGHSNTEWAFWIEHR